MQSVQRMRTLESFIVVNKQFKSIVLLQNLIVPPCLYFTLE
jgi:hypothetical protein